MSMNLEDMDYEQLRDLYLVLRDRGRFEKLSEDARQALRPLIIRAIRDLVLKESK